MSDKYSSIIEFSKLKKECAFCQTRMNVVLTNFIGITKDGIPTIRAPLVDGKFSFNIVHTTADFDIKAEVVVDAFKNVLLFTNYTNGELPAIDEYLVRQTFEEFRPHIELYCPNSKCGLKYHLWGSHFILIKIAKITGAWRISPFKLILEGAVLKKYVIHNNWEDNTTRIYSRLNTESRPIEVPLVDFTSMDKDRLTNRIQTIVTFS